MEFAAIVEDAGAPGVTRAAALREAMRLDPRSILPWIQGSLAKAPVIVRRVVAEEAHHLPSAQRVPLLSALLRDSARPVRLAARANAGAWIDAVTTPALEAEHVNSLEYNLDRPEGALNLANHRASEDPQAAVRLLEQAIERYPDFAANYVNLADLQRALGLEAEAEATLRRGIVDAVPEAAALHQSLGLALIRQTRRAEALQAFARAAELDPRDVEVGYVLAIALWDAGRREEAVGELHRVAALVPHDPRIAAALASYEEQLGAAQSPTPNPPEPSGPDQ
jgi:tetratricopeptide (TPR) repeat protein